MTNVILIIVNTVLLIAMLYFMWENKKNDRAKDNETLSKLYETIGKMQIRYFESLEKHNKEFLKVFGQVFKKDIPTESVRGIEADKIENSIEENSGPEEISLADTPRIPIVDGVNIKFEDEAESQTININPMEEYQDKSQNPIEK